MIEADLIERMRYAKGRDEVAAVFAEASEWAGGHVLSDEFREMGRSFMRLVGAWDIPAGGEKRYNPSQPRDRLGRWTDTGVSPRDFQIMLRGLPDDALDALEREHQDDEMKLALIVAERITREAETDPGMADLVQGITGKPITPIGGGDVTKLMASLDLGALLVGGSVRDAILRRPHNDEDFVVPGHEIGELRAKLERHGSVETLETNGRIIGLRFKPHAEYGDVPKEGVEIALPRREVSTGPGHQDFDIRIDKDVPIEEDLQRRDFTMNAMAQDVSTGVIIDPYGGRQDARNGVIKTITPQSFRDDPLRTLRALRFQSQLDFDLDPETRRQMMIYAPGVENVSGERIRKELDKLLVGKNPGRALRTMADTGVLQAALPELAPIVRFEQESKFHDMTLDGHVFKAVQNAADRNAGPELGLALLFHDSGKPESSWRGEDGRLHYYANEAQGKRAHEVIGEEIARTAMKRMGYDAKTTDRVGRIIRHHMLNDYRKPTAPKARKFIHKVGRDIAMDVIEHRRADMLAKDMDDDPQLHDDLVSLEEFRLMVADQMDQPLTRAELAITGNELASLGFEGPEIGEALDRLLKLVVGDPNLNTRERLLRAARGLRAGKRSWREIRAALIEVNVKDWRDQPRDPGGEGGGQWVGSGIARLPESFSLDDAAALVDNPRDAFSNVQRGGRGAEDKVMTKLIERFGLDGKPAQLSTDEFEQIEGPKFFRGVSRKKYAEAMAGEGELGEKFYVGYGLGGSGSYAGARDTAERYAQLRVDFKEGPGWVVPMAAKPGAKVLTLTEVDNKWDQEAKAQHAKVDWSKKAGEDAANDRERIKFAIMTNPGRRALLEGYDLISLPGGQWIVLNRTAIGVAPGYQW